MPLACTQTQRTLPIALRHGLERLLGSTDDGGQGHDDQRQAAGQQTGAQAQCLAEHQHTHQAIQDAGDACQGLVGKLDQGDQPPVGGVLGQIDRCTHAQRQHDQQCEQDHIQGVQDGRQDAVGAFQHAGGAGQKLPAELGHAPPQHDADDTCHQQDDQHRRHPYRSQHQPVLHPAGRGQITFHGGSLPSASHSAPG